MSIVGVTAAEPPWWVWAGWLVAAIVMAAVMGFRRPRRQADAPLADAPSAAEGFDVVGLPPVDRTVESTVPQSMRVVPLLAVTGLISFCVWIGVQVIYVSIRRPSSASQELVAATLPTVPAWSSADLARLSLISGMTAWGVAVTLLILGRGVREIGYGIRRLPNGLLAGAIGIFIALPMVYYALQITLWVLEKAEVHHPDQHELLQVIDHDPKAWVRTAAILSAVVAAPLFEELLFRGCIQGGLRRVTQSPWIGILVASGLFMSLHAAWTMPPLFVFSVLLGLTYERTRNLWATTCMHAMFNAFSIIFSGMS
ncbi:MAG: prenyl protease-related protein [Phycisphaerales bacterium]|nr:prenyl protease-related protein [Phycisphaerales bacterium]